MASPRSTPFIASLDSQDLLDATAPLDEIVAAHASSPKIARAPAAPSATAPSRRAWSVVGIAAVLAASALVWAAESDRPRTPAVARPARVPPAAVRAELQAIPARIDLTPPDIAWADEDSPSALPPSRPPQPRPARTSLQPRDELAAALLERRRQMSQRGIAGADVDAVAAITFDPSRRSARVVYRIENSADEVVEYWAVRDGRWQALND